MNTILVFRTSRLFEADLFAEALEESGIPYFRRMDAGGVELAMPAAPADYFGTFWSIYVPAEMVEAANELLEVMPFDRHRDRKWQPTERDQRNWRRFVWLCAAMTVVAVYYKYCVAP